MLHDQSTDTAPEMSLPVIGIVGAGQLARMMIQAAIPLALPIRLLAAREDDGAVLVARDVTIGSPDGPEGVARFAAGCDVVTFDHELVPPPVLDRLVADGVRLAPSRETMLIAQNKRFQRERFAESGLPQPRFGIAVSVDEALTLANEIGRPVVLKAASGGYDGRGVWMCADRVAVEHVAGELVARGIEVIVEEKVDIRYEYAALAARSATGETAVYEPVKTVQVDGICRETIRDDDGWADDLDLMFEAQEIAKRVAELTGVVGILAVELFLVSGDRWVINEIATRPHNSGHWTIEGATTSQFEQHLRAVAGLPLGITNSLRPTVVTVNVLGPADGSDPASRLADALRVEGAHIHLYGKPARPGRKLGHVTVLGQTEQECRRTAWAAVGALTGEAPPEELR